MVPTSIYQFSHSGTHAAVACSQLLSATPPVLFSNTVCWREVSECRRGHGRGDSAASVELHVCQALTQAPYHPLLFMCNPGMIKN